jgi:hypothetical protein
VYIAWANVTFFKLHCVIGGAGERGEGRGKKRQVPPHALLFITKSIVIILVQV